MLSLYDIALNLVRLFISYNNAVALTLEQRNIHATTIHQGLKTELRIRTHTIVYLCVMFKDKVQRACISCVESCVIHRLSTLCNNDSNNPRCPCTKSLDEFVPPSLREV